MYVQSILQINQYLILRRSIVFFVNLSLLAESHTRSFGEKQGRMCRFHLPTEHSLRHKAGFAFKECLWLSYLFVHQDHSRLSIALSSSVSGSPARL